MTLPSGLQTLAFGYGSEFRRDLEQAILPSGLQTLTFGSGFDQSLEKASLPMAFRPCVWPSAVTDQSRDVVTLPSGFDQTWGR